MYSLDPNLAGTPSLYIPGGSLSPSTIYIFRLAATVNDSLGNQYENYADVELLVLQSYARAIITPGDRTISRLDPITLNATQSLRPDQDPSTVTYQWDCLQVGQVGQRCFGPEDEALYFNGNPIISLLPATLHPGSYLFTLTVNDPGQPFDKNAGGYRNRFNASSPLQDIPQHSTTVTVNVVVPPVPSVNILPISVSQGPNLGTETENPYSQNNQITSDTQLRIEGTVSSRRPITSLSWAYYPTIFPLSTIATTPVNGSLTLSIKPGSLYSGIVYRFVLTAVSADGVGSSSTDVYVVQPPISGDIIVSSPQSVNATSYLGTGGLAQINATALFWEGDNGTNPYRFWVKNTAPLLVNTYNQQQNNNTVFGNNSVSASSSTLIGPIRGEGVAPYRAAGDVVPTLTTERPFTTSSKLSNKLENIFIAKGSNISSIVLYASGSSHAAYRKEINLAAPPLTDADCPANTFVSDSSCQLALVQALLGLDANNNNIFANGTYNGTQQCLFCSAINSGDSDLLTQLLFAITDLLNQGPITNLNATTNSTSGPETEAQRILRQKLALRSNYILPALNSLRTEPNVEGFATQAALYSNLVGRDPTQLSLVAQSSVLQGLNGITDSGPSNPTLQSVIDTLSFLLTGNNLLYSNYSRLFNQSGVGNFSYYNGTGLTSPVYDFRSRSLNAPTGPDDFRQIGDFADYEICSGNASSVPCACAPIPETAIDRNLVSSASLVDIPYHIGLFTVANSFPNEAPVLWQPPSANIFVLSQSMIVAQGMNLTFSAGGVNVTLPSDFPIVYNNNLGLNQAHTINIIMVVYPFEDPRAFSPTATYRATPVVSFYIRNADNGSFVNWRALYPNYGEINGTAPTQYFYNTNGTLTALNTSVTPDNATIVGPTFYYNPLFAGSEFAPVGAILYRFARTRTVDEVDPDALNLSRDPNVLCNSWDSTFGYIPTGTLTGVLPNTQGVRGSPSQATSYTCTFGTIGTQVAAFYQFPILVGLGPGPNPAILEYSASSSSFEFNWGLLILWVFFAIGAFIVGCIVFWCYVWGKRIRGRNRSYYVMPAEDGGFLRVRPNVGDGERLKDTPLARYYTAPAPVED
eukprot:TRINITY_DN6601_c0_g1_i1.p1 TRINITY_DN6601_c0_g1~~TRINITY_DN6601_c0_g1_i1.p1  ORF type:complete len:1091 (+),score=254.40 TRINITY_DN6601_c0_g1_i1:2972-6244(+)